MSIWCFKKGLPHCCKTYEKIKGKFVNLPGTKNT
jgi:hypothetical protein